MRLFKNPVRFTWNYFQHCGEQTTYALRSGTTYRIRNRTADFRILREVLLCDDYQPKGFEIQPTDTILDIGGQIGIFTVKAAQLASKGHVFAFEPFAENYALLKTNIELNNLGNVTALNRAVAAQTTTRRFFVSEVNTGGHSLYEPSDAGRTIEVETISLQDFLEEHALDQVDFAKIDCEGAEVEILMESPDACLECIRRLAIEVHDTDSASIMRLEQRLTGLGFNVRYEEPLLYAAR